MEVNFLECLVITDYFNSMTEEDKDNYMRYQFTNEMSKIMYKNRQFDFKKELQRDSTKPYWGYKLTFEVYACAANLEFQKRRKAIEAIDDIARLSNNHDVLKKLFDLRQYIESY